MNFTVKLFATFRTGRFGTEKRDYETGTTVANIIEELEIPAVEIGATLVNGRHVERATEVVVCDILSIFQLAALG